jgi:D-beta-D-heptose 7-phosphate kinase/D-beta-D-heptose 1-phosphate adenosyltransferase
LMSDVNIELKEAMAGFAGVPMLVVGDLILDHYIWGRVNRISPEAPVVVVEMTEESKRLGGAGNVAANLLALGAEVHVCGVVGEDPAGSEMLALLEQQGADVSAVVVDRARPTTTKTRVIASAQQVVRVDREVTHTLSGNASDKLNESFRAKADGVQGVLVSDYAKGVITESLCSVIKQGYQAELFGLGRKPVIVDPKGPNFGLYSAATVIKPNRKEAEEASRSPISDRESAISAGKRLLDLWNTELLMITLGEDGMVLVGKEGTGVDEIGIGTVARDVYDVSGAGDTVSAVFGLALASGASPLVAAQLSNYAAGIVVAEVGTVAVDFETLKAAID